MKICAGTERIYDIFKNNWEDDGITFIPEPDLNFKLKRTEQEFHSVQNELNYTKFYYLWR